MLCRRNEGFPILSFRGNWGPARGSSAVLFLALSIGALAQNSPLVIAFQPPAPNSTTYYSYTCGTMTQYMCFLSAVLPHVSGIGVVIPWGQVDNCGGTAHPQSMQCVADSSCTVGTNCFAWNYIDGNLAQNFINYLGTSGAPFNFNTACAGGKPCKIVFIVWLTQDSGGLNTYDGLPVTPLYVFTNSAAPQDVVVCKDWQGGGGPGTGWAVGAPISDSCWPAGGPGEYGLWNVNGAHKLASQSGCTMKVSGGSGFTNFSGYPVMYEAPIQSGVRNFLSALALHYSTACTFAGCTSGTGSQQISGATIAPYVAYMRIGPSSGGENYPYCACVSSTGGSQCDTFYWPGPKGYDGGEQGDYSDQGYLTEWPSPLTDGTGYVAKLYNYIHSLNWAFPIDTPTHNGPASNMNVSYSDTEAQLASEYGLGMGMQAASIGDPTYQTAISNFLLGLPSATSMHNNMSTSNSYHY